jgi:hypothetical protein
MNAAMAEAELPAAWARFWYLHHLSLLRQAYVGHEEVEGSGEI